MGGTQRNTRDVAVRDRGRPRGRDGIVSNRRSGMGSRRKVEIEDENSEEEEKDDKGDGGEEPYIPASNPQAPAEKRCGASESTGRPRKQKVVEDEDDEEEEEEEEKQDDDNEENPRLPIPNLQSYSRKTTSTSPLNMPAKSSETNELTNDRAPPAPGTYKYPRPVPRPLPPRHIRQHAPPSLRAATGYYVSRLPPLNYSPPPPTGDPRNHDPRNSEPATVEESRDQEEEQVSQNSRNYSEAESALIPKKKHTLEDEFKLCAQNGKAYAEHVIGSVAVTGEKGEGADIGNRVTFKRRAKVGVRYREVNEDEDGEVAGDVDMEEDIREEEETGRDEAHIPIPSNTPHANTSTNRPPTPPRTQTQVQNLTPPPIPTAIHRDLSTEIARVTQLMNSPFSTLSATERAERINRQTSHKKLVSKRNGVGFGLISPHDSWQHAIDLDDWICVEKIKVDEEVVDGVDGVDGGQRGEMAVRWRVWAEERVPRPMNGWLRDPREIRGG